MRCVAALAPDQPHRATAQTVLMEPRVRVRELVRADLRPQSIAVSGATPALPAEEPAVPAALLAQMLAGEHAIALGPDLRSPVLRAGERGLHRRDRLMQRRDRTLSLSEAAGRIEERRLCGRKPGQELGDGGGIAA